MAQTLGEVNCSTSADRQRFGFLKSYAAFVAFLLVFVFPLLLSDDRKNFLLDFVLFSFCFFFPGYLVLAFAGKLSRVLRSLLSPVFGIASVTTAYAVFALISARGYFPYVLGVISFLGLAVFVRDIGRSGLQAGGIREGYESLVAGCIVCLCIAPVYWRSGRFSAGEFVFYGPAGQDPLFHVTLLQRLLHHIPPDNFIISGLRTPAYHYFDDLTLALLLRAQTALHFHAGVFELYYRFYPLLLYFLLGALAYRASRQLSGTIKGGILGVVLLLGAGGLACLGGMLQTAHHAATARASFFSDWNVWDHIGSTLPLVHRPAHYHGLLFCLAALNLLLTGARSRRAWILSGLLLGLMAGFNFTLAATFGIAAVLASFLFFKQGKKDQGRDLGWLAVFIFLGSLPMNASMWLSGVRGVAAGFPFRGPNLEFPMQAWGATLAHFEPAALVPWTALILFPLVAYGVKLIGVRAMARLDLGAEDLRAIAAVFAIVLALSFVIGTFFPYQAFEGVGIIFLQPTLWILGLFSLLPLAAWLKRTRSWLMLAVCGLLAVTWVQALASFNFSHELTFDQQTVRVFREMESSAAPDDVVAYLPSTETQRGILGPTEASTNFATTAMTGLDGYFCTESYSEAFAVPGMKGQTRAEVLAQAERFYQHRRELVESFLAGDIAASTELAQDHVAWVVAEGEALPAVSRSLKPWRKTGEIAVYRIPQ